MGEGQAPDFRELFRAVPGLYILMDLELRVVDVSDAQLNATRVTRAQACGRFIFDVYPADGQRPGSLEELRQSVRRCVETGEPHAMPVVRYDIARADGRLVERHWSRLNMPVTNTRGEVAWILHRLRDVTENVRLRADEERRDAEFRRQQALIAELLAGHGAEQPVAAQLGDWQARADFLTGVIGVLRDGIIGLDEDAIIVSFSPAAERMFGYAAAEIEGRSLNVLVPEGGMPEHAQHLARYLESGERRVIGKSRIVMGARQDGSSFPVELTIDEVKLAGRRRFVGIVRDLTELEFNERRTRRLQVALMNTAGQSTMGEITSTIAHELNQPLAAISNYLRGARRLVDGLDGPQAALIAEAFEKAAGQSLRAGEIIHRLRQFISRGETERRIESLEGLIEESLSLIRAAARDLSIRVDTRLDPAIDLVLVDKVQIQQVLMNLLRNALEAMLEMPGGHLLVSAQAEADRMARIEVCDSGAGLAADIAERLFQPFVTTKKQGMGIGLSISRTIVTSHGGEIAARPNPAGGTIFSFTVRRFIAEEARYA